MAVFSSYVCDLLLEKLNLESLSWKAAQVRFFPTSNKGIVLLKVPKKAVAISYIKQKNFLTFLQHISS